MKKSALALAAVLVLALTVLVSTGSAADVYAHSPKVDVYGHGVNVHPDPFGATGFSSGRRPGRPRRPPLPRSGRPLHAPEDGRPRPRSPARYGQDVGGQGLASRPAQGLVGETSTSAPSRISGADQTRGGCAAVPARVAAQRRLTAACARSRPSASRVSTASAARATSASASSCALEVGEHPVGERARVAALRPADADAEAEEVLRLEVLRDRAQAVVAGEAAAEPHLQPARLEVRLVVDDEHRRRARP